MTPDAVIRGGGLVRAAVFPSFAVESKPVVVEVESPPPNPEEAARERARLRAEAEREGYAAGLAQGRENGERLLREQAERLAGLLVSARVDLGQVVGQLEGAIIELALTVAGQVTHRTLTDHPEIVGDVVRSALTAAAGFPVLRVRVNPTDYAFLNDLWPAIDVAPSAGSVELREDASVEAGGCIVDTAAGFIDAQPSTRLEELRRQILSATGEAR